jgi:hypothetical protein
MASHKQLETTAAMAIMRAPFFTLVPRMLETTSTSLWVTFHAMAGRHAHIYTMLLGGTVGKT